MDNWVRYKTTNIEVSPSGQIRCWYTKNPKRCSTTARGYISVYTTSDSGIKKAVPHHRIMAECFIPNPHSFPVVNHKNEIKNDNRIDNLEWCTSKYNAQYSANRLVIQLTLDGEFIKIWGSGTIAEEQGGFNQGKISEVCRGRMFSHNGYIWIYLSDYSQYKVDILRKKNLQLRQKQIVQYDIKGNFISDYPCAQEASRVTGVKNEAILKCLNNPNKLKSSRFIWIYKDNNTEKRLYQALTGIQRDYIVQITKEGKVNNVFPHLTGYVKNAGNVLEGLKGRRKTVEGYMWKYYRDVPELPQDGTFWNYTLVDSNNIK